MFDIESISSVYESNNFDLKHVASNLVVGLKLVLDNQPYIVGQLALNEGISPHRNINASPDEVDYNLLMNSGLLVAAQKLGNPITVTTGLPFSTYMLYKDEIKEKLTGEHKIVYNSGTYTNGSVKKVTVEVDNVIVMPEVVGCALGLRKEENVNGTFFMLSLGYGTLEGIVSTPNGIVQRSSLSVFGLRYAVNLMKEELGRLYYLDLKNEHQLDVAFREAAIVLNRKRIDLTDLRKKVLQQYYNDVVSPALRKAFDDSDFARASKMYLAGGGSYYTDLLEMFNAEFDEFTTVVVPGNAGHLAAIGYCYQSTIANGGDEGRAVGIDVGNSSTVVCTIKGD